ncbi:unnamed protein product [Kuraishia capsulata CBS 1993]|uniref:Eukaryotic translation initiation factor 3 subunit C n=1 Tax=Kuraishia capsulata CBS 1993 TaxID=1382522 RepID=W6MSG9_9ASCO|nr:uncharacterized protein KUCA_T00005652001 [Kuraishia capsulata CBS 1993]CDK29659.1 unnamed protein product [Kuraishia capsulata CBS 1993]
MTSRFFAAGYSDSDSASEEELVSSSEEEEQLGSSSDEDQSESDSEFGSDSDDSDDSSDDDGGRIRGPSYFLKKSHDDDDSSDDEDTKKVVKSAKDKMFDELSSCIDIVSLAQLDGDWIKVSSEFDRLVRLVNRAQQQNMGVPKIYIKAVAQLDKAITDVQEAEKESKKNMNASVAKSFNIVRQRIKKVAKEHSAQIQLFRADEDAFDRETSETPSGTATPSIDGFKVVGKDGKATGTPEVADVFKTLETILASRGKKNVDLASQIAELEGLLLETTVPFQLISIYLMLIPLRFDLYGRSAYMPVAEWKLAEKNITALLAVLEANADKYAVTETGVATEDLSIEPKANDKGVKVMIGSVASLVERLDDELTKSWQSIDPHATEYVERLKDESLIYTLIVKCQLYYESITPASEFATVAGEQLARVVLRRLDHIYFKPSKLIIYSEEVAWTTLGGKAESVVFGKYSASSEDSKYASGLIDALCSVLYKQPNSVFRKRAVLSHIYYYAFNDEYFKARDMLLMSHLQSAIHTSDTQLQVLFNRALVQLGLCAFRSGLIAEAQQALQEIATSPRQKELLGQGAQRFQQQQTQVDKQRLLPFHMHINLELLECCFYTASLLIEVPAIASSPEYSRKRQQSTRSFRRTLEYHERQIFEGPPENTRDYIMDASVALQKGDWLKASDLLNSIKIWGLLKNQDSVKAMLREKLQVEGLRTYLFTCKSYYEKLSIASLAAKFELPERKVNAVISKMIYSEEINAALDQKAGCIVFIQGVEITKLQELALTLADKAVQMAERNERLAAGGHQNNQIGHQGNNNSGNSNNTHAHNSNSNIKLAPVTGALQSAPGTISGALNGMDRKYRKNHSRK